MSNPHFSADFLDLFNHIGLSLDNRFGDLEKRLRALLVTTEENNQALLEQKPDLSSGDVRNWITRLSFEIDTHYNGDSEQFIQQAVQVSEELLYIDLLIVDDDVQLDEQGLPVLTDSRASIAQDIKHMIRESGLLIEIVGQRDKEKRALNYSRIIQRVDDDYRIVTGTCDITEDQRVSGASWLTATTFEYGDLGFWL